MKFKPTLGALIVALALVGSTLTGCNSSENNSSASTSQQTEKFYVSIPANDEYTVSGLDAAGYTEGSTVTFTLTLAHPEDKAVHQVTATAGSSAVTVTALENGGYSFKMPAHDVSVTVALKNIDRYALSYTGSANVDETITMELSLGNAPVADDFVVAGKTDADAAKVSISADNKVTLLAEGKVTLVAKIGNEVKAELELTVGQSMIMSIKNALDAAVVEAPCNAKSGKNANMSSAKTIAGQVLAVSSYYNGAVQTVVDDGTAAVLLLIAKNETDPDPVAVGDNIRVTTVFTNYYGLLEGISKNAKTSDNANNIPAEDVIKVNKTFTPSLATAADITAAQYDTYYTACAANGASSGDSRTWSEIKNVNINVTFDKVDTDSILFNIDGSTKAIDAKATHDEDSLDKVKDHKSTLSGFLLGVNSSKNKSNMIVMRQQGLAVENVELSDGESISLFKNNEKTLAYTTTPAGSYGTETWVSSNPAAVTVQNGVVHAVAQGEADVTLTINGHSDTIHIIVSGDEIPAQSVSLDATAEVEMGKTLTLTPTTTPAVVTDRAVWASDNEAIATVADGVVTPVAIGKANITVTYRQGVSATCEVTVKAKHGTTAADPLTAAEALVIGKAEKDGWVSSEQYYIKDEVKKIDDNSFNTNNKNATFWLGGTSKTDGFECYRMKCESSVTNISDFRVGAVVTVKSTIKNYSGTIENGSTSNDKIQEIYLEKVAATGVSLNVNTLSVYQQLSGFLVATVTPANSTDDVVWTTSDASVATVANGVVTGVAAGTATITATAGQFHADCAVTVSAVSGTIVKTTLDLTKTTSIDGTPSTSSIQWTFACGALLNEKKSSSTNANNYYPGAKDNNGNYYTSTRFYKNQQVTVTPGTGYKIYQMVFKATSASYATAFANSTFTNASAILDGNNVIVAVTDPAAAVVVAIGGACGFTAVEFSYVAPAAQFGFLDL